jgi:alkanesulfonate monooxygenase SsuD/methylene tetrahydromethanopterin reductase-like flavin-dependent oxidoreductase (luciferase family)
MAAIATRTERLITGPLVTPLARRRPQQLARETVTLDRLSAAGWSSASAPPRIAAASSSASAKPPT